MKQKHQELSIDSEEIAPLPNKPLQPREFPSVIRQLAELPPGTLVTQKALGDRIAKRIGKYCTNLCGRTRLREAMALIERCTLFVTNDSGLMHVAAALNVPLIAIFGSTNPITTGPWGPKSRVVRVPIDCSPCLKPECPETHFNCMNQIDVDMVYDAVNEVL